MTNKKKVDTDKLNLSSIIERAKGETPKFWKKVQSRMIWLVGVAGTVIVMAPLSPIVIPAAVITTCGYIAFGGAVLGIGSIATMKPKQ